MKLSRSTYSAASAAGPAACCEGYDESASTSSGINTAKPLCGKPTDDPGRFEDWELTQDTLRDRGVDYNPKTGEFTARWRGETEASRIHIGDACWFSFRAKPAKARVNAIPLIIVEDVRGATAMGPAARAGKRIVYLRGSMCTDEFCHPKFGGFDHINRQPDSNWIDNLREATKIQNGGNTEGRRDGLKGAYWR